MDLKQKILKSWLDIWKDRKQFFFCFRIPKIAKKMEESLKGFVKNELFSSRILKDPSPAAKNPEIPRENREILMRILQKSCETLEVPVGILQESFKTAENPDIC